MRQSLENMYNQRYKLYNERYKQSVCGCFADCEAKEHCPELSFICNRSVRVGTRYESSKIRVVFIGKEDVSPHSTIEEPASFCEEKNQHYVGTKYILAALLGKCSVDAITNYKSKGPHFEGENQLHEEFALTNHYHCVYRKNKKRHGIKTTGRMWDNCVSLVRAELEILHPHIVVIQAGWTAKKKANPSERIDGVKAYFDSETWSIVEDDEVFGLYLAKNTKTDEVCYIIGSYHPSFPKWNKNDYLSPLKKRICKARKLISN